jgi:WD40 repeat protein
MSLEKKITFNLLDRISINENVVDDFLDQEMQEIDNLYGDNYDGLSTKVLSLFAQNGKRLQISKEDFIRELSDKRHLSKEVAYKILDRLKQSDLIHCTNSDHYELANNTLVQRVDKKVEAENSLLRNMRVVIRDHMTRDELLDQQYLDHIAPFMTRLELDAAQKRFVERSHTAIHRARRRRRLVALVGILLLLGFATVTSFLAIRNQYNFNQAQAANNALEASRLQLEMKNDTLRDQEAQLREQNDSLFEQSEQRKILIDSLRKSIAEVQAARAMAEAAQDSIERANLRLNAYQRQLTTALKAAEAAEERASLQRDTAIQARREALIEKRQSDLLAISLNAAVRSQSVTNARTQGLISRQAYELYLEYVSNSSEALDPEGNHPYIFTALRQSLRNLAPEIPRSVKAHNGSINDILVAPDGKKIYTAGSDGQVKEWSVNYWLPIGRPDMSTQRLLGLQENVIYDALDLSEDGRHLLVSGQMYKIQLYDFDNNFLQENLFFNKRFSANDKVYASAFLAEDDDVQVMALTRNDFYNSQMVSKSLYRRDFSDPYEKISTRANTIVNIEGKVLGLSASTEYEGDRFYINLQVMDRIPKPAEQINFVVDGKANQYGEAVVLAAQQKAENGIVAIGMENGHLIVGKVDLTGQPVWKDDRAGLLTFRPHQAAISDITFSQNGNYMAVASYDGTVSIWDLRYFLEATYQPLIIDDHRDWVRSLSFAHNDRFLIAGTKDGRMYFWNFNSPDYAQAICNRLSKPAGYPNYDRLDDQVWEQFFGNNIRKDDQICR